MDARVCCEVESPTDDQRAKWSYYWNHTGRCLTCDQPVTAPGDDFDRTPGRYALIRDGAIVATAGPMSRGLSADWVPIEDAP